ncbi:hypothetical protein Q3V37_17735 [Micromonospora profundi]|uniref:Uncharacterized protein n=1 Tax=Micromonospora profundi TaxID=1420889 RepID=A0AAJ6L2E0_9ACTN|nr:hypothetical protein [Micromonospora profundi]WLS43261.1 hypothetical protein Q3V37_17735 [Micromonospora profundi]
MTAGEFIVEGLDAVAALNEGQITQNTDSQRLHHVVAARLESRGERATSLLRDYRDDPQGRANLAAALDQAGAAEWSDVLEVAHRALANLQSQCYGEASRRVLIDQAGNVQVGDHNTQVFNHQVRAVHWVPALAALLILTVIGTYSLLRPPATKSPAEAGPKIVASVDPSPMPAPATSPPVLVENLTSMRSNDATRDFVLPRPLEMTEARLEEFNRARAEQSFDEGTWFPGQEAAAVNFGTMTLTLRGNADEQIRITEMRALKRCSEPLSGTYFRGYSQGSGDTLKIGFDMDDPNPVAQRLGYSGSRGLFPTGESFFDMSVVTLEPGEKETLLIGAFTKRQSCTFTIRLVVSTSRGTFFQDIDQGGRPFRITAVAPAQHDGAPLSGYRRVYAYLVEPDGTGGRWRSVDPATYGTD